MKRKSSPKFPQKVYSIKSPNNKEKTIATGLNHNQQTPHIKIDRERAAGPEIAASWDPEDRDGEEGEATSFLDPITPTCYNQ